MRKIELNVDIIREKLSTTNVKLPVYCGIMDLLHKTDVSTDTVFQMKYKSYYGMSRFASEDLCRIYFQYMEIHKERGGNFADIVNHIYAATGRVEPSFSSKLVHTINPAAPIWDSRVRYHLGLKRPLYYPQRVVEFYSELCKMYEEYMITDNAGEVISVFDEILGDMGLTAVKKIDTAIWVLGKAN